MFNTKKRIAFKRPKKWNMFDYFLIKTLKVFEMKILYYLLFKFEFKNNYENFKILKR